MNKKDIYPITIIKDRYGGIYSKGYFLAFNKYERELPDEIDSDDVTCHAYWLDNKDLIVGKGNTPEEAYNNLIKLIL